MNKICILDYGFGNIKSLTNALKKIGYDACYYSENNYQNYDLIIIPGVGSFSSASKKISDNQIVHFLERNISNNCAIMGICLGMQLMHTKGYENGENSGLNFISGKVKKIEKNKILPIIGWKKVEFIKSFKFLEKFNNEKFYFVHSYCVKDVEEKYIAGKTYADKNSYISSVIKNRFIGTQFHPEKSGDVGLDLLKTIIRNFI